MVAVLTGFGVTIQGSERKSILVAPWLQCLSSEGLPCMYRTYARSNLLRRGGMDDRDALWGRTRRIWSVIASKDGWMGAAVLGGRV